MGNDVVDAKADRIIARILVVDDERDAIWPMRVLLESRGYETRGAATGMSALEIAPVFRPDVVLLDIGLPEMDGFETARRMRREPWCRETVLVAVTGWGRKQAERIAAATDFDGWLLKPVEFRELAYLIQDLLPSRNGALR